MDASFYTSAEWRDLRELALSRDGHRCTVAWLAGGECSRRLDAHHIIPIEDGGAPLEPSNVMTCCSRHHPMLEAARRTFVRLRRPHWRRCRHDHRYPHGRVECERKLNRTAA